MRFLSEGDVRTLIDEDAAIRASAQAFAAASAGQAEIPVRTEIHRPDVEGIIMVMPGLVQGDTFGLKIIANRIEEGSGRLVTQSMVLVFEAGSLEPIGLISADYFTDLRTAAGIAAATDALARPDAATHVVFGAGKLAGPSIRLVSRVRPISRIIIVGRSTARVDALTANLRNDPNLTTASIESGMGADEATEQADIVTAVTSSTTPVCDGSRVRPGTHINIAGAFQPTAREMDDAVAAQGLYFVDSLASCLARAGDVRIPLNSGVLDPARLKGEIGSVFSGETPGRSSPEEITVFKSLGNAVQDLVLGASLLRNAPPSAGLSFNHRDCACGTLRRDIAPE